MAYVVRAALAELAPPSRAVGSEHFARLALGTAIPVLDSRERAFFETLDV
jgi:hypothetical protein